MSGPPGKDASLVTTADRAERFPTSRVREEALYGIHLITSFTSQ
jgi:hypothetical protein